MRSIGSNPSDAQDSSRSLYSGDPSAHALTLLRQVAPSSGVVLDLGCRDAVLGSSLSASGYTYVGVRLGSVNWAPDTPGDREIHTVEADVPATLAAQLKTIVGDRPLAAVMVVDLLEQLTEPRALLHGLSAFLRDAGPSLLILTAANVTYTDVATQLLLGHWDDRADGPLRHRQSYTAERLEHETRDANFLQVAAHDVTHLAGDPNSRGQHPVVAGDSPVATLARRWSRMASEHSTTTLFVRAFVLAELEPETEAEAEASPLPAPGDYRGPADFLTVVMRTQGRRPVTLRDALTCLAAQTVEDFHVDLIVHSDDERDLAAAQAVVMDFHPSFRDRVHISRLPARGGRSRPLNVALARSSSEYVAFLDDDDLVTADWVEAFAAGTGTTQIVRAQSAARFVRPSSATEMPYVVESGLEYRFDEDFVLIKHLWENQTPICAFAIPTSVVRTFNLTFDESMSVLEDWDFLLRSFQLTTVKAVPKLTSIVNLWLQGESSRSAHTGQLWKSLENVIQERLDSGPFILPTGSVSGLIDMHLKHAKVQWEGNDLYKTCLELIATLEASGEELSESRRELAELQDVHRLMGRELAELQHVHRLMVGSKRWRVLGPLARAMELQRKLRGR